MNKKSIRMTQWILRVMAISLALMLFSVPGGVVLLSTAHASGLVQTIASDTPGVTPSATNGTTPTPTDTPTPAPTQAPTPTPVPTKAPKKQPISTPTASAATPVPPSASGSGNVPIAGATATALALGPAGTQVTPTPHKDQPTPTPSPGATATPAGSGQYIVPSATTTSNTAGTTDNTAQNGMMMPLAGAGAFIVLSTTGLVGLVVWRRRKATQTPGVLVAQTPWPEQPVLLSDNYYSQPTEFAAPAASGTIIPFALQGFSQYSPLLGAPGTSQLNTLTPLPASDFRPLQLDFPQIIGMNDGAPIHTPLPAEQTSPADRGMSFPQLPSTPAQAEPALLDIQPAQPGNPPEYQEPQSDPFLEAIMQHVQMGIFALPGKDS